MYCFSIYIFSLSHRALHPFFIYFFRLPSFGLSLPSCVAGPPGGPGTADHRCLTTTGAWEHSLTAATATTTRLPPRWYHHADTAPLLTPHCYHKADTISISPTRAKIAFFLYYSCWCNICQHADTSIVPTTLIPLCYPHILLLDHYH